MNYFFPWIQDLLQSQTLHLIISGPLLLNSMSTTLLCLYIVEIFEDKVVPSWAFFVKYFRVEWCMGDDSFHPWISHLITCDVYLSLIGDGLTWLSCCFFLPSSIWYQRIYKKVRFTEGNTKGNRKVVSEI